MLDDTIAAISTPLGEGGIGIVRLSGRDAIPIAAKLFLSPRDKRLEESESHRLIYGYIRDPISETLIDEVLVSVMKAPNTYTREDIVEINCHGGFFPMRKVLELVLRNGARLAGPGEFTKRAFLNGRIDLSQAEAVLDLIRAKTDEAEKMALRQLSGGLSECITSLRDRIAEICACIEAYIDFPEEGIEPASRGDILEDADGIRRELSLLSDSFDEGRFFREGIKVAIVGRPNVGKSSLLNALIRRDRAIVTETPGTTRDVLEEYLSIKGLLVRIMDTAGIRETHEMAEKEGVRRSLQAIDDADLVIVLIDGSTPLNEQDIEILKRVREKKGTPLSARQFLGDPGRVIIAINKTDLPSAETGIEGQCRAMLQRTPPVDVLRISAKTGEGLEILKDKILELSTPSLTSILARGETNGVIVTNIRHRIAIDSAIDALKRASSAFKNNQPLEIVAIEMRDALDRLGEIVGAVTTEDILDRIFSEFCVGK